MPKDLYNTSRLDDRIAKVVVLLMAIGTVFVFSASATLDRAYDLKRLYTYVSVRQILFFPIACLVMYLVSLFDHTRLSFSRGVLRSLTPYLLVLSIVLCAAVLIPGIGAEKNFSRRWFSLGVGPVTINFQPSEFGKWTIIFFVAAVCARLKFKLRSFWLHLLPICLVIGVVAGLIVIEDLGTAALVALVSYLMLCVGGGKWWHLISPVPVGGAAFYFMIMKEPYRLKRLIGFLEPEKWADTVMYQANQSLVAMGSGGLFGKGLGNGICKYGHVPEDTTDLVFAIIGEELGLVGTLAVILIFVYLLWLGLRVVLKCRHGFSQLLATGIVLVLGIQAALNIGVATVVLPTKGIQLPFLSAGGSSLLMSAAAAGVLLNIARQAEAEAAE
ncbi:MAG: putative lipid II flippase FtsW [Phycisphaerae bacterium]|nr:putative lipid II flippase FtsW [Phycisphaerae bacterium]